MSALIHRVRQIGAFLFAVVGIAVSMIFPMVMLGLAILFCIWLFATRTGQQTLAITATGIATLPQRLGAASVVVVGIGGVVGVLIALLALAGGFEATLHQAGGNDSAIVLRASSQTELNSGFDRDTATLIAQAPGILRDEKGVPITSAEVVVVANLPKRSTGTDANVEVRGVGKQAWVLRSNVKIIAGRAFTEGKRELVVGKGALSQFAGLEPGATVNLNNQHWQVVGVFASDDAHDSEIWGDVESIAAAYRRRGFQSVTVRLTGASAFDQFKAALATDPRLKVDAETTRAYYQKQSEQITKLIRTFGTGVAVIMAIGAIFGALNTMYAAIAARAREIATLRALGFGNLPVITAVLLETMLLALLGGSLGAVIAFVIFNGYTVSTLGSNFSQVVFQFQVSPGLLLQGLQWALAIGFIGGLFPALHAARLPITMALREL